MITTKRKYAGSYKVYKNGVYVGHIDKNGNDQGEWIAFDKDGEYISHNDTKKFALMDFE